MLPMTRNNYFNAMSYMPSLFNDIFNDSFISHPAHTQNAAPQLNVSESDKNYTLEIAMPGVTKEMTSIELTAEGTLIVKAETKKENEETAAENKKWLRREFGFTSYTQSFTLPEDIDRDAIKATVSDGVLSVVIPKKEPAPAVNKTIEIK